MSDNKNKFLGLLDKGKYPLLSDGAMGTLFHQRGINFDQCFDELNITQPALVGGIHREYIDAGSNIIQTNTFGANRYKLARHGLEKRIIEINTAGVELARRVIMASFKEVLIAGDIGPLGVRLAPFGRIQLDEACHAFKEQINALASAGCNILIIETFTDLYEVLEAIKAAKYVDENLPIIASMTFTRDDRTLLGDSPAKVARAIHHAGADVIGANCSGGPNQLLRLLQSMRQEVPQGKFSIMPNAGWPEQVGGRIMYAASPEYFSEYALTLWQAGADIIGGCCGTTPNHIAAMSQAIKTITSEKKHEIDRQISILSQDDNGIETQKPTDLAQRLSSGQFIFAVEMDPPRGLSTHKILAGASLLAESGADVINVADSPMARMRMSPWAVCNLIQRQIGIETVLHFPIRGRNLLRIQGDLLASHATNVRNVFVVMGDPTSIGDYPGAMDNYDLVPSGLIKLIKQGFNTGVDHSGSDIGQPTSFFVGCALNLNPPDIDSEINNLRRKINAGADFILTQPIYDLSVIQHFLEHYEKFYSKLSIPLIIGILPLVSSRHASFLQHEVPGINIPQEVHRKMQIAEENGARAGIKIAIELINGFSSYANGVYLMPAFNRFDYTAEIIESVKGK